MLNRIYIDNYKTFINFTLDLQESHLFLGENGMGKSTIFEVLNLLKSFILERKEVEQIFTLRTLTRWQTNKMQNFELTFKEDDSTYHYKCSIEHHLARQQARLFTESLTHNGQLLFEFNIDDKNISHAKLYNDHYQAGPELPFGWSQSGVGYVQERGNNQKLIAFKNILSRCFFIQWIPCRVDSFSEKEEEYPDSNISNYINWYRYFSQDTAKTHSLVLILQKILPDFVGFKLDNRAETKYLQLQFKGTSGNYYCRFDELSDGQKSLCVLYTLINNLPEKSVLAIDEPENFLALKEINLWLDYSYDNWCGQLLLISHHPKIINHFDAKAITWFSRENALHTRNQEVSLEVSLEKNSGGISVAELVERGWLL